MVGIAPGVVALTLQSAQHAWLGDTSPCTPMLNARKYDEVSQNASHLDHKSATVECGNRPDLNSQMKSRD
jgi:hypothetical protein